MAAVRLLGFWELAVFIMWPLSACRYASAYKISTKSDSRSMSRGQKKRISRCWTPKISIFGDVTVTGFIIWCSVQNFIKIGQFFTKIWRFNDFQNGGRPPSWILYICIIPVALVSMPFCFLIQNFAEIGQSIDELWPKKPSWIFLNFNFWSRDCNLVRYLM